MIRFQLLDINVSPSDDVYWIIIGGFGTTWRGAALFELSYITDSWGFDFLFLIGLWNAWRFR